MARDIYKVGGIDFGTSRDHPFVFQLCYADCTDFKREVEQTPPDEAIIAKIIFYLYYEYRDSKKTMEYRAKIIKDAPGYSPDIPIFADPSAKQERIDLEETHLIPTLEADNAVEAGIDLVRAHLHVRNGKAHFYIIDGYFDCEEKMLKSTDEEFDLYKYKRTKEGFVNRKEPLKTNDHGMDSIRYIIKSSYPYFRELFMPVEEDIEQGGYWFGE